MLSDIHFIEQLAKEVFRIRTPNNLQLATPAARDARATTTQNRYSPPRKGTSLMPTIAIDPQDVTIHFNSIERLFTARGRVTVPLAAVRSVEPTDRPMSLTRGGRMGLTSLVAKIGTWGLGRGIRQLVCANRSPGLHIVLDKDQTRDRFDEIILSIADAPAIARALELQRSHS